MKIFYILVCFAACCITANAQLLIESGASFTMLPGSKVYVAGDVISNASIKGGTLVMNGTALQTLSMNGDTITSLQIDNPGNVVLGAGSAVIDSNLSFINGNLKTSSQDLVLTAAATVSGAGATGFVWTDSTGILKREITADVTDLLLPLGENGNYSPAFVTAAGNNYTNAYVGIQFKSGLSASIPLMIATRINGYWPVQKNGISGGTLTIKGQYNPADVIGNEAGLAGYYYDGLDWTSANETHNTALHQVSVPLSTSDGVLTAMNKFLAVGARAFLQGAYVPSTGLMNDALRVGTNIIPLSDPYRTAPYSTFFIHLNNPAAETAAASVFTDRALANDNIVDWVFLELRNANTSPGNAVLQTRSALIQRDGDIVDVDGVSPVTFNNLPGGNYILAVRHRNHLGISLDPATAAKNFTEKASLSYMTNVADFRLSGTPLFGPAGSHTIASHPVLGNVNLLWAGNASMNTNTKYTGLQNDKDYILINALGNNSAKVLGNVYSPADINMNRTVRFNGLLNDKDYLYITILASQTTTQRLQSLPN